MKSNFLFLFTTVWMSSLSWAGGLDGGGGMGYVCYENSRGQEIINRVLVLDFYEAQILRKLTFSVELQQKDHVSLVAMMKDMILRHQGNRLEEKTFSDELDLINRDFDRSLLPPGVRLPPVTDGDIIIKPQGCEKDQLAYYRDEGNHTGLYANLLIVGDYWEKMDTLNQASLIIHEAVYRVRRKAGDVNSDITRDIVGDTLELLAQIEN
jgi:hypothetical protein